MDFSGSCDGQQRRMRWRNGSHSLLGMFDLRNGECGLGCTENERHEAKTTANDVDLRSYNPGFAVQPPHTTRSRLLDDIFACNLPFEDLRGQPLSPTLNPNDQASSWKVGQRSKPCFLPDHRKLQSSGCNKHMLQFGIGCRRTVRIQLSQAILMSVRSCAFTE